MSPSTHLSLGEIAMLHELARAYGVDVEPNDFGLVADPNDMEDAFDEPFDPTNEMLAREVERQARIAAGVEHVCACCGCSESRACAGGCVWAAERPCSKCA